MVFFWDGGRGRWGGGGQTKNIGRRQERVKDDAKAEK